MIRAWKNLREVMPYLPQGAKRYMIVYVIVSSLLSILDIAALMLLAVSITSMLKGNEVEIPLVGTFGPESYVWIILCVSVLIVVKSALSLAQQWAATRRFSSFELTLGTRLFDAYLGAPWVDRLSRSTSQLVRMADVGVAAMTSGLILPLLGLPSLIVSTVAIVATLLVVQPLTAVVSIVYLGMIALFLYYLLSKRSVEAGRVNRTYSFKTAGLMTDMVGALKEITLRDKMGEVASVVRSNRAHATRARANIQFLASVPKFVMDTALIGGFLLIGGMTYVFKGGMDAAVSAVVMFAVAGMRLVPALTGFQGLMTQLNANVIQVQAVLGDIREAERYRAAKETVGLEKIGGDPSELVLEDVTFTYPSRDVPAVREVNLSIAMGSSVGLVGESGSGKSTLVDIMLGLLIPGGGRILIDGHDLRDVLADWRSRVGYVPQDVSLFDGTIEQNVALSWGTDIDRDKVIECLQRAQMWETVQARPGGLRARVGERGIALSGGQRQRLGIARALYTDPLVLILDEATSALDTKTEAEVAEAIHGLRGEVTLISVAHRLSTIRDADELFFMEDGAILAHGTFDQVVARVPAFARQAALAGLALADPESVDVNLVDVVGLADGEGESRE